MAQRYTRDKLGRFASKGSSGAPSAAERRRMAAETKAAQAAVKSRRKTKAKMPAYDWSIGKKRNSSTFYDWSM